MTSYWLDRIDPFLAAEWTKVLAQLELLSDTPAAPMEAPISRGKPGGSPPRGTRNRRGLRKQDMTPWDWYDYHLGRIVEEDHSDPRIRRLLYEAQSEVAHTKYRSPNPRRGKEGEDRETEEEFQERIVREYEGVPAEEVAFLYERCRAQVIMRARQRAGVDPDTGDKVREGSEWHTWPDVRKRLEMRYYSGTQREAANHFGISLSTVKRYWNR